MRIVRKQDFDNSWFDPGGSNFKKISWYFFNILIFINPLIPFYSIKRSLLRLYGARVGKRLIIKPGVNIKYPWLLDIGDYVSIGENVWIDNLARVKLNDQVTISQGAMLLTGNHNYKKVTFDLIVNEIVLEDGVWIGAKSVVCPGVICRSHSILTVGSTATKEMESYGIYQGNPATKIKKRIIA